MQKRKMPLLLIVVLGIAMNGFAQEFAKVGTVGSQFLKIDLGARAAAMGGVNQLAKGELGSLFLNPAGLAWSTRPQALVSHTKWLADMPYNAVAGIYPVRGIGVFGAYVGMLSSGDIEETTVEQQNGTGRKFSTSDMVVGIGYGRVLTDKFSVGGVVKYVREDLDDIVSSAMSIDVGVSYDVGIKGVSFGMSIRNFGPEIRPTNKQYYPYDNGSLSNESQDYLSYQLPLIFKTGIGWEVYNDAEKQLRLGADLEHPNDNVERIRVGGEYVAMSMVALRTGYIFRHDTAGMSAGLGLFWKQFRVDYAYVDYGLLDYVQRFDFVFTY